MDCDLVPTKVDHEHNVETGPATAIDEAVEESLQVMLEDIDCEDLSSEMEKVHEGAMNGKIKALGGLGYDQKQASSCIHHSQVINGSLDARLVSLQDLEQTQCDQEGVNGVEAEQHVQSREAGRETELMPPETDSAATAIMMSPAGEGGLSSDLGVDGSPKEQIEVHNADCDHEVPMDPGRPLQIADIHEKEVPARVETARESGEQGPKNRGSIPPCVEEEQQQVVDSRGPQATEETVGSGAEQGVVSKEPEALTIESVGQVDDHAVEELPVQPNRTPMSEETSIPTNHDKCELELPLEETDTGPIPFFIIDAAGPKAASPHLSNDTIDFGVPGARITADQFVGMRYVREGSDPSQAGSASPGARLLEAIQEIPAKTVAAAEKTITSLLAVLPSPRKSLSVTDTAKLPESSNGDKVDGRLDSKEATGNDTEGPSDTAGSKRRSSFDSAGMHVWEIIWKDHSKHSQDRPGGTLQQVQFETSKAGFRFIQRIIDVWSLEATDSSAMTGAAKALLKAQDRFENTAPGSPFSKPETISTFPRSLFGRARSAANGAPAASTQTESLQRAPSEASYGVERTESGLSVADSVESVSSVKSVASGSSVSIALVASGNRNGYEGGLQHVVIPESEDVSGGSPPVEKPGAPLVEGRFLPNMIPHSHVLQQPHIRALAAALPVRFRLSAWALLYSTWRDGISLQTLYRKAAKKGPGIMVILDTKHNVFGCYTSENWKVHPRYHGSGECFVFQLYPEMRIYRWTHDNSYFMFGTPDSIHIGGGSHFALSVRGDLLSGCTGACETFGNGPLVTPEEYGILQVELWGFQ